MREVPAKPLPSTVDECHAEIRRINRERMHWNRTAHRLEEFALSIASDLGKKAAQVGEYSKIIARQRVTIDNQARVIGKAPTMYASALTKINAGRQ